MFFVLEKLHRTVGVLTLYRLFDENLDKFLDLKQLDDDYRQAAKKKGNESLNPMVFRRKYPNKYMNREIWIAWEWLLHLIEGRCLICNESKHKCATFSFLRDEVNMASISLNNLSRYE